MQQKLTINHLSSVFRILYSAFGNLYICRESSTNQPLFMQNKPNLKKAKMNVNLTLTKDYRTNDCLAVRINKPNFFKCQNERKLNFNKGLQKKRLFSSPKSKPNSNPIKPNFFLDPNIKELIFIFKPGTVLKDYHTERILI